jgi:hypothetical protein
VGPLEGRCSDVSSFFSFVTYYLAGDANSNLIISNCQLVVGSVILAKRIPWIILGGEENFLRRVSASRFHRDGPWFSRENTAKNNLQSFKFLELLKCIAWARSLSRKAQPHREAQVGPLEGRYSDVSSFFSFVAFQ